MSKVHFRLRGKSDKNVQIKLRLSINRTNVFEVNSGFNINPKNWSAKSNFPIQNSEENKLIDIKLKKLESHVTTCLFQDSNNGTEINRSWLQEVVDDCFGKVKKKNEEIGFLVEHLSRYIELAPTKKIKGKSSLGLAANTIRTYNTFKNLMIVYEGVIKRKIRLMEIDKYFINKFTNWLLNTKKYSINYAGKQIDHIKTICNDADEYNIPINEYCKKIESFSEDKDDRYIVTLSFDELEKIWEKDMPTPCLENAKKWLLLGCQIGQRGGDLLNILPLNLKKNGVNNNLFLDVYQQKTRKWVTVVVMDSRLINIIENHFPYQIPINKLNEYIKTICRISDIDEIIDGKKHDGETKRKRLGRFPKHELITSHSFRRSFATNWFGSIETSLIMNITGHTRESQFKEYINVREDKDRNVTLFMEKAEIVLAQMKKKREKNTIV